MKYVLYFALLFLNTCNLFSQNIKATYSIHVDESILQQAGPNIKSLMKSIIEEANQQKIDLLISNKITAFIHQKKLSEKTDEKMNDIAKSAFTTRNPIFIDFTKQQIIEKTDDNILIESKASQYAWQITSETKTIGTHTCYKATLEEFFKNRRGEKTSRVITAWFAPALPYNFGPTTYYGLPGLIVELTENRTTYILENLQILNTELKINYPKGKTITQEVHDNKLKAQMGM